MLRGVVAVTLLTAGLTIYGAEVRAAGDCSTAALSYYCLGVTVAMSQATKGPLAAVLLDKAASHGKNAARLGHLKLREKYQTAGVEDTAKATGSDKMKHLVVTCVSGDRAAIASFVQKAKRDCHRESAYSRQKSAY